MKMEELKRKQAESLARREELLQDMEKANQMTQREREVTQRQKEEQAQQLGAQVLQTTLCPSQPQIYSKHMQYLYYYFLYAISLTSSLLHSS